VGADGLQNVWLDEGVDEAPWPATFSAFMMTEYVVQ
jgi:hypothetical protein